MERYFLNDETRLTVRSCATVGFFDGVHGGHRFLLEQLRRLADGRGERMMVVTFERHPRQVVQPEWQPRLLTTLDEKLELLSQAGVDVAVVLRFDAAMAGLSAREFMEQVLRRQLGVNALLAGYDNRFGHGRREGFDDYADYGRELGIEVARAEAMHMGEATVSSSHIRQLLAEGRVAEAAGCLGYAYELEGRVVHGEQIGRQLGFPTANIVVGDAQKMIPAEGVYAVAVDAGNGRRTAGMMNIGRRPTFGRHDRTLEVHLIGFDGDLYDRQLRVRFVERLRGELTFGSPDALKRQMAADREMAKTIINRYGNEK